MQRTEGIEESQQKRIDKRWQQSKLKDCVLLIRKTTYSLTYIRISITLITTLSLLNVCIYSQ